MANPPVNRRPGVDADIFQGTWVRGYDVPAGDQTLPAPTPCDLIVSNGKSQIDQTVSNLIFANRTDDIGQPIFVMLLGEDPLGPSLTSPPSVGVHIGDEADPNGLISVSRPGSLYVSTGTPGLWQLQGDTTTWLKISDDSGGEDLAETLVIGNFTGGTSIRMTNGDFILGVDDATGVGGAPVDIRGGNETNALGDGGGVILQGGTSVGGTTGNIALSSPTSTGTGGTGGMVFTTGGSFQGAASGGFDFRTGDAGSPGIFGDAGDFKFFGGESLGGNGATGGQFWVLGGDTTTDGQGGHVFMRAGTAGGALVIPPSLISGGGGGVFLQAGASAGTVVGGAVSLTAGDGGPGGAAGGHVSFFPGGGGGGGAPGITKAWSNFEADNIKRGTSNPNGVVSGNEGDVYQRIGSGNGQLWLNRNGTVNGWSQMALSGDFINSFEQMNWGYLSGSGANQGGTPSEQFSAVGTFEGLGVVLNGTGDIGNLRPDGGPALSLRAPSPGDYAGLDHTTLNASSRPFQITQDMIVTFRVYNTSVAGFAFFGLSEQTVADHASAPNFPGGNFFGFAMTGGADWQVVTGDGTFNQSLGTGVAVATTMTSSNAFYFFVIDAVGASSGSGPIRFHIFDPDLNLISTRTAVSTLPGNITGLGLVLAERNVLSGIPGTSLYVTSASLVADAGNVAQGGGNGGAGSLALNEVLNNGNETGATLVQVNQGSGLLGVTDDNAGDGASFGVFGGATTLAGNDTGTLNLGSGNAFGGGAESPGSSTGDLLLSSGFQFGAASMGDTGLARVQTGDHLGLDGTTGDVVLRTGGFFNGGAGVRTQGDILIAPGSFVPNTATVTGEIIIKGGSSSLTGVTGGDVTILSGENNSAIGDTGVISIETFDVNLDGASGDLQMSTGDAGTNAGTSGAVTLKTGDGIAGSTGAVTITTGDAGNGSGGAILIANGDTSSGNGAQMTLTAGDTSDAGATGGSITLNPGTGGVADGEVIVNGKLTVTGLIDPTGLLLEGQAALPVTVPGGDGLLWVDDTAVPSRLFFTDDVGTNHDIGTGGGASTLGALTDVTIAAPVPGEILALNGGLQWVNMAGAGGSPLATILAIGNATGALPIVIEDTLGSFLVSDADLQINPGPGVSDALVFDSLRWPTADGLAGQVLTTNGLGQLSFQAGGGGGGGTSFGEAFTRMQWGTVQAATQAPQWQADGVFTNVLPTSSTAILTTNDVNGYSFLFDTPAAVGAVAGVRIEPAGGGVGVELQSLPLASFKFDAPNIDTSIRFFVGLTDAPSLTVQTGVAVPPATRYVGLQIYTDVPQTTFHFVTDDATGAPTTVNTTVNATGTGFELVVDASVAGAVTLTLYDNTGTPLATTTFLANLPLTTVGLGLQVGMTTIDGVVKSSRFYGVNAVTRADLLNAVGGGGGNQNLASVLGFGAATGGVAIQGDDNGAGAGGDLDLIGGSSTGGGGAGGDVTIQGGSPNGAAAAGDIVVSTVPGAGAGDGGDLSVTLGAGGAGGGSGGGLTFVMGDGILGGSGGAMSMVAGDSGTTGGLAGTLDFTTGSAGAGSGSAGASFTAVTGSGDGVGDGGAVLYTTGAGGAGGGDGGNFTVTLGVGNGGGSDGVFLVTGDAHVTGKLTVDGMIDPPGLLMSSSGSVPFTPVGTEGGVWVNAAGELVYTNLAGDLNLSSAIGGGLGFLDGLLVSGYGFLGAGNPIAGPQSYGVYGSSVLFDTDPGPPPASFTFGQDTEGPFDSLALGNVANSEAFVSTADIFVRRDSQFKAVFKFQVTSAAHTTERIFIGFTDEANPLAVPSAQLLVNDPAALQYMGLRQDEPGFNLEFVARGSGGAMAPVFAIPTDALVHYFVVDASASTGDVTFKIYDDSFSEPPLASWTEPSSFLLPDLANPTRPFIGLKGQATTPRALDFYFSSIITRADVVDSVVAGGGGGGTSDLAAVLGAGNNAGSILIEADGGIDGGAVDLDLTGGTAGGAAFPATLSLDTESGDNGGQAQLQGGDGAGAAGNGGRVRIIGRDGVGTGGGGDVRLISGNADNGGGDAGDVVVLGGGATGVNGTGGSFLVTAGNSFGNSIGGTVSLTAGDGGVGPGTGDGGNVELLAGTSAGTGGEGKIRVLAGSASPLPVLFTLDSIQIVSSPYLADPLSSSSALFTRGTVTRGGDVQLTAGSGAVGSGALGGNIELRTRGGDGGADGGRIFIFGGGAIPAPSAAPGGDVQIVGGTDVGNGAGAAVIADGGSAVSGGAASVLGGDSAGGSGLAGGAVNITAGDSDGAIQGAHVEIEAGDGGGTGHGGHVNISGVTATGGASLGGNVKLTVGPGPIAPGLIQFVGSIDPVFPINPGIQFSFAASPGVSGVPGIIDPAILAPGAPPTSFLVVFNTAVAGIPQNVQVTLAQIVPGPLALIQCAVTSITTMGFTLVFDAAPPAGLGFMWKAML